MSLTSETPPSEKQEVLIMLIECLQVGYMLKASVRSSKIFLRVIQRTRCCTVSGYLNTCDSHHTESHTATPEKLCTAEFMRLLDEVYAQSRLNRLVVDEVNCLHVFSRFIPTCQSPSLTQAHCISVCRYSHTRTKN